MLRAFTRAFAGRPLPDCYYGYIRAVDPAEKKRRAEAIACLPEWKEAGLEVWNATLGQIGFDELHSRIRQAIAGHDLWGLLGGPPCQAYSVVGRSRRMGIGEESRRSHDDEKQKLERERRAEAFFSDEKHTLYREYLKIVAIHQPPFFVMENVKGILSSRLDDGSYIFDKILEDLGDPWRAIAGEDLPTEEASRFMPASRHGYYIHSFVAQPNQDGDYQKSDYLIRCEDFGVPQERHRVILLGIREDLNIAPTQLKKQGTKTSLAEVIGDLPELRSGRSGRVTHKIRMEKKDTAATWIEAVKSAITNHVLEDVRAFSPVIHERMENVLQNLCPNLMRGGVFVPCEPWKDSTHDLAKWFRDDRLGGVLQHETRDHMDADFARYLFVAAYGEVMTDSPKLRHFPHSLLPDHENAKTEEGRRVFHDRFRVQLAGRPATTVTCHIRKDGHYFIHYDPMQCRSLTVREAARVQTFPDNYFFEGNRTEQYEQVGNPWM
ncbi:DNA-cytosine methyltransferase [Paramagnetospirillum caucaseum]|uniref:DNA (cytosine-5-)-methyltransferase n=2 Tax=Paramagnetospirillum caucaseum TaxID=1244869 RepID=M3A6B7_9PROT|nr:DNA-cytosine methyltransferase [Paramagnetospirillum caucaseum]